MACYQCSAEDGTDIQLCAECRKARGLQHMQHDVREITLADYRWDWHNVKKFLLEDSLTLLFISGFALLLFLYFIGLSSYGPGIFLSKDVPCIKSVNTECPAPE